MDKSVAVRGGETASTERRGRRRAAFVAAFLAVAGSSASALAETSNFPGPTEATKAPKGVKLAIVSCSATLKGCQVPADAAVEAAKALGWEAAIFDGRANPKTQASAMLDALSWGATFILASSIDYRSIQLPLAEAKKAGVPVASVGQGGDTPNALPVLEPGQLAWAFAVDPDNFGLGKSIGEWIIKDSDGKANVVAFNDKEFDGVVSQHAGIMDAFSKCPGCKADEQTFSANQIATNLGQQVVGYLRAHPDVNYVYMPYDPAAFAVAAALRQAGLTERVKLASLLGDEENIDLIRKGGGQVADVAFDTTYEGYAAVDQIIRYLNKQKLFEPHGENVPMKVLDKTNLPDKGNWIADNGYKEKYLKLWK
jgi:ribose transport system substrate-binding protein